MSQKKQDLDGILMSLLYLVKETSGRNLPRCADKLLEAAYAMVKDCENDPEQARDLFAALQVYTGFSSLDNQKRASAVSHLENERKDIPDNAIFAKFKGKKQ